MDDMSKYVSNIFALNRQNNSWSASQAQKQMDFQERMSNTAHVREIEDLKAAGLNPVLSAKLGGASTPSGAMAEADTSGSGALATLFDRMMENNNARELKELTLQHEKEMQAQREQHDFNMERMKQEFQLLLLNGQNATLAAKSSGGSGGSGSGNKTTVGGNIPEGYEPKPPYINRKGYGANVDPKSAGSNPDYDPKDASGWKILEGLSEAFGGLLTLNGGQIGRGISKAGQNLFPAIDNGIEKNKFRILQTMLGAETTAKTIGESVKRAKEIQKDSEAAKKGFHRGYSGKF